MTDRHHFECPSCGWETKTPDHVLVVFHPCKPTGGRRRLRRVPMPEVENVTADELRSALWAGFESVVPDESLYRGVEE